MEQPTFISHRRDEPEFSLREWAAKAKLNRDPTISRRFSGSYIRSFREDARSFRSNITSTASSPGYPFGGFCSSLSLSLSGILFPAMDSSLTSLSYILQTKLTQLRIRLLTPSRVSSFEFGFWIAYEVFVKMTVRELVGVYGRCFLCSTASQVT